MLLEPSFLLKINALIHSFLWVFLDFPGFGVGPCWMGWKTWFNSGDKVVI